MTRFRDCPPGGSWKTGDHCTRHVGRDQVTRPLTCYCTRTSVIEEGDRISARFTYNGTFSKAFMGYQPNGTADQMRSSDIWRVKDGKLIEHWDKLNLLEVFQQIGAATVRKPEGQ
jgi:hypothetical protein